MKFTKDKVLKCGKLIAHLMLFDYNDIITDSNTVVPAQFIITKLTKQ